MKFVGAVAGGVTPPDPDELVGSVFAGPANGGTNPWDVSGALWHDGVTYKTTVTGTTGTLYLLAVKDDGTILTPVVIHTNFQIDAHDSPSMVVLPNDKLLVMYCKHNSNPINVRVSTAALDSSGVVAFDAAVNINSQVASGGTYTDLQLHYLSSTGLLYLIFRKEPTSGSSSRWCYSTCNPASPTTGWAAHAVFWYMAGARKYVISWSDGDSRIDFASMGNPGDIGHFYWDPDANIWYSSAGVDLGVVDPAHVMNESRATLVYSTRDSYAFNVGYDGSGNPRIVGGPYDGGALTYFLWHWNGSTWITKDVGDAGVGYAYNAGALPLQQYGMTVDDGDPNRLFIIKDDAGGQPEVYAITTSDDWATYSAEQITDGSSGKMVQIIAVRHRGAVYLATWDSGTWAGYTSYNLGTNVVSVAP